MSRLLLPLIILLTARALVLTGCAAEDRQDAAAVEFFEQRIRPVLVEHCYKFKTADADALKAGLRLDQANGLRDGGDSGPAVVPGKPSESLLIGALKYESFEMPPSGPLPDATIRDFETWISHGAIDPREAAAMPDAAAIDLDAGRSFWAFQNPVRAPRLETQAADTDTASAITDSARIDALVTAQLHGASLSANPAADRRTLLRRLTYDLTGLPPTFDDVQSFVADQAADAVERCVDELLARTSYGERWARMWLDVARYGEDQAHIVGDNKSLFYPNAWKYREWVIEALNRDLPYDDFVRLQLAADLIAPDDAASHVALGFIGLGPKYYARRDPEVMAEEWADRVDIVSRGLLGLTITCARCHDHKYDPIRTEDYYGLAGVFASTEMFNRPVSDAVEKNDEGQAKDPAESLHIIRDAEVRDLAVMIRGNVKQRGDIVPRGFPAVLCEGSRLEFQYGAGRRELAEAIASPRNPLTARVIVNRVWQEYFGTGLVATSSNFGKLGERPTHPELLDDLAVRFMDSGWSLKWLHRQIVLSDTYQRTSDTRPENLVADPDNRLLWRMPRRRLSVEAWRDSVLAAAGRLDLTVGGRSMPPADVESTRRTIYAEVSRLELNPLLARFDFPDPNVHAERRAETNTPLQKLFLLNSPFMLRMSGWLAERAEESGGTSTDQMQFVFRAALQREADDEELQAAEMYVAAHPETGLQELAQSLLVSNEFWFLD